MRPLWFALGAGSLALGAIGTVVPLLPTVPFVILAAFAFGRSSPRLEAWLLDHSLFGGPIRDWRRTGTIRRPAKWIATASIGASFVLSLALGAGTLVLAVQIVALGGALAFIWSRPG